MAMKIKDSIMMLLVMALIMTGCQDDDINVTTDTADDNRRFEVAGPGVDITYTVSDYLEEFDNEYLRVEEDGLLALYYEQFVDIEWETLVQFDNIQEVWTYSPESIPFVPEPLKSDAQYSDSWVEKVVLSHRDDVRYDSSYVASGTLEASLSIPDGTVGTITLSIPEVINNEGNVLSYTFNADGSNNQTFKIPPENLSGMNIFFKQENEEAPPYESYIQVVTDFELDKIVLGEAELSFELNNLKPDFTFGDYGQQESAKRGEELGINLFEEVDIPESEQIEFENLEFSFEATSGIGVPFDVIVKNTEFFDRDGVSLGSLLVKNETTGENEVDSVFIHLESAIYDDPVQPARTSLHIDKDTSNIMEIGNNHPTKMVFDVISRSNPDGEPENPNYNFMGPSNILEGKMTGRIPLWFKTSEYNIVDTIDFNFRDILGESEEDARELEKLDIYFDFYSKLPFSINATAYVIDENGNKIDDLFEGEVDIIKAGMPDDETGYVQEAEHTEFIVSLSDEKVNKFLDENAMNIVMDINVATRDEDFVRIFEDMDFRVVLSFDAAGKIPSF